MKPVNVKLPKPPQSSFKFKKIELPSLEFNWHCHPEYEIMLMMKSRGKRFIGDNIDYYQEGDLFFIGPNLPHAWYSQVGAMGKNVKHQAILIQFVENFAGLNVHEVPELNSVHHLFSNTSKGLQFSGEIRKKVADTMIKMESLDGMGRLISLFNILNILSKSDKKTAKVLSGIEFSGSFYPDEQSRIDRVCTYINKNYQNTLRLDDAAEIVNMSATAFSRFFRKSTGKTFVNYVNELRIGKACKLLIESEYSVAEICYEVGFNNLSNFNRRFHERHHRSPREYRQEFAVKF